MKNFEEHFDNFCEYLKLESTHDNEGDGWRWCFHKDKPVQAKKCGHQKIFKTKEEVMECMEKWYYDSMAVVMNF